MSGHLILYNLIFIDSGWRSGAVLIHEMMLMRFECQNSRRRSSLVYEKLNSSINNISHPIGLNKSSLVCFPLTSRNKRGLKTHNLLIMVCFAEFHQFEECSEEEEKKNTSSIFNNKIVFYNQLSRWINILYWPIFDGVQYGCWNGWWFASFASPSTHTNWFLFTL